jgi:hypothetical protein
MRMDDRGVLPLLVIVAIVGVVLAVVMLTALTLTLGTVLALVFVGAGLYLLVKPERLAGMGATMKMIVPLVLIMLGVAVYAGWLGV